MCFPARGPIALVLLMIAATGCSQSDAQSSAPPKDAAIIAGMLPVALGRGDGAASRASLATVVVGGQALCLLVTLLHDPGDLLDVRRHAGAQGLLEV